MTPVAPPCAVAPETVPAAVPPPEAVGVDEDPFGPTVIRVSGNLVDGGTAAAAPPAQSPVAGWFGKLPMLGDFASRRLPDAFIGPWDEWLQASLASSRSATGDRWLDLYLTFPVWRFALPAGLIGDRCWIGVLLPSVDRVGRCFPLTICEPV